jgi:hypothetical protein
MTTQEIARLVAVAYDTRRYLKNVAEGRPGNSQHDPCILARRLTEALDAFVDDFPPTHDLDKRDVLEPHQAAYRAELMARR